MTIDPDFKKLHRFNLEDVGKYVDSDQTVYGKVIWNAAIEAAANKVESAGNILLAHSVRELKK